MSRGPDQYIRVFTGRKFWPLDPRPEEIDILDIAHALSMNTRWGGHCHRFYSVAQHSLFVARYLPTLEALLHDASEGYLLDMPRPLKRQMPEYSAIEDRLMRCIADRFDFQYPFPKEVKAADDFALYYEKLKLFPNSNPIEVLSDAAVDFFFERRVDVSRLGHLWDLPPRDIEKHFLERFSQLYNQID